MKLNYPMRFFVTLLAIGLSAWFWVRDGVDRGLDLKGGASLTYRIDASGLPKAVQDEVLQNSVRVIEERINTIGLKDVKVDALPPDQFEVQFPGKETGEVDRIKSILTKLGQLEFRIIAQPANYRGGGTSIEETEQKRKKEMGSAYPGPPEGYRWIPQRPERDSAGNEIPAGPDRLVEIPEAAAEREVARLELDLERYRAEPEKYDIEEAERQLERAKEKLRIAIKENYFVGSDLDPGQLLVRPEDMGAGYVVLFGTIDKRKEDFGGFTERNIKRLMAIIIDGKMNSAPVIQSRLPGSGRISGGGMSGFTKEEATDLVTVLRSGSLDVGIILQSEFAIGPSLGEAAIRRGIIATSIGFAGVVIFMLGTYFFPGLVAIFALLMNLLIIMGALAFVRAQLSLPGIAGVILTVGMAVDANILVFERIREERKLGKSLGQALRAGYERAFVTIVDANVTTLFTAVVLYLITTGQVRGFAATLFVGILASMFTALYVTKTIFGFLIDKGLVTEMRMPQIIRQPKLSYMRIRLLMIAISLAAIGASIAVFTGVGEDKYDIEFVGGQRVVVSFSHEVPIKDVKERLFAHYPDATIVSIKSDTAEAKALDLSLESDSFQITIAAADTPEEREQVYAFLEKEFRNEFVPHGVVAIDGPEAEGAAREFRLSFEHEQTADGRALDRELVLELLSGNEGMENPEVISVEGKTAHVRVELPKGEEGFHQNLETALKTAGLTFSEPFPMKSFVDPTTAKKHRDDAIKAVFIALIFQILYIYLRFRGASFGFAAVIALVHDVFITLGAIAFFSFTGLVNVKINLPIIAAVLTLIGYSMNDSIVVFDRIRENLGRGRKNLSEVIDQSVNQTMGRTLRTSLTTLVVLVVLFIVNYGAASSVLEGFAFVLIIGVLTGTYSSIFIASPMLLFLPWHYLRGRGGRFWFSVVLSLLGGAAFVFATAPDSTWSPTAIWLSVGVMLIYPLYFLTDLVRWLFISDPDRALNIVLRSGGARV